ncbi:MAG: hypothetical protein AAGA03_10595 [Planctomycetota bacterium]
MGPIPFGTDQNGTVLDLETVKIAMESEFEAASLRSVCVKAMENSSVRFEPDQDASDKP